MQMEAGAGLTDGGALALPVDAVDGGHHEQKPEEEREEEQHVEHHPVRHPPRPDLHVDELPHPFPRQHRHVPQARRYMELHFRGDNTAQPQPNRPSPTLFVCTCGWERLRAGSVPITYFIREVMIRDGDGWGRGKGVRILMGFRCSYRSPILA